MGFETQEEMERWVECLDLKRDEMRDNGLNKIIKDCILARYKQRDNELKRILISWGYDTLPDSVYIAISNWPITFNTRAVLLTPMLERENRFEYLVDRSKEADPQP